MESIKKVDCENCFKLFDQYCELKSNFESLINFFQKFKKDSEERELICEQNDSNLNEEIERQRALNKQLLEKINQKQSYPSYLSMGTSNGPPGEVNAKSKFENLESIQTVSQAMIAHANSSPYPSQTLEANFSLFTIVTINTVHELTFLNRKLEDDMKNLNDDLSQMRLKLDKANPETIASEKMCKMKSTIKQELQKSKEFNLARKKAGEQLNNIADECLKVLEMKPIELDEVAANLDYEKEIYTKLFAKLNAIRQSLTIYRKKKVSSPDNSQKIPI